MTWTDFSLCSPPRPYELAFWTALPFGVVVGIHLPDPAEDASGADLPDSVMRRLFREEAEYAQGLSGFRLPTWVGGRIAVHEAIRRFGGRQAPLLPSPEGGVIPPPDLAVSISHKRDLAVGMAAWARNGTLGVDLENSEPARLQLAPRILTGLELARLEALPPERQWLALLLQFSMKESLYKAIHPYLRRFVGFHEAELDLDANGGVQIRLALQEGEGPFRIEGSYHWIQDRVLTTVRVWPTA